MSRDAGVAMIDAIVGTLLSAVLLALVGTAAYVFIASQAGLAAASNRASELAVADIAWRLDVKSAIAIGNASGTHIEFTVPQPDGTCRVTAWDAATDAGRTAVTAADTVYAAVLGSACTGEAQLRPAHTVIGDAGTDAAFEFTNPGGRGLSFVNGTATLAPGAAPTGVPETDWESGLVGKTTLTASIGGAAHGRIPVRISQIAASLLRYGGTSPIPGTQVSS